MKLLLVNTFDIQGGAARAAYRLHQALLAEGVNSQMLVQSKSSNDFTVLGPETKIQKAIGKLRPSIEAMALKCYQNKSKTLFSSNGLPFSNVVKRINEINPDIVHLHWVCGGMMPIEDIAKIKVPIVWSLHDMWAFTGGCHNDESCGKYKSSCYSCPVLKSDKNHDLSKKVFKRKQVAFKKTNSLTIVGLSNWLNNCSKNSTLLKNKKHINLPNPIDTNTFKPFDKENARELWGLPKNKKIVMFGGIDATQDPNKGFKKLSEALEKLQIINIELVIFGSSQPKNPPNLGFKSHYVGRLQDDVSLITLYSAADVMIVPSLQEAFGQTASESMSCGTPVVAFATSGLLDIVDHQTNGYLAKPFDTTDLKDGIEWVLNNKDYDKLCQNAREKILKQFDSRVVAKKYIKLYESILED